VARRSWRRRLFSYHRDVGLLALGMTVVYAVSGIAVNHREHWDYDYSVAEETVEVGQPAALLGIDDPGPAGQVAREHQDDVVRAVTAAAGRSEPPRKVFWRSPVRLSLFFSESDQDVVDYLPEAGVIEHTVRRPRLLIRAFNTLHLNRGRALWTWVADIYAVALIFLAASGILMLRGRHLRRGVVLVMIGATVPLLASLLLG
jgi:hypothetical protein